MKARPASTAAGDIYEVFAKFNVEDPLRHVGNVIAPDPQLAGMYAYTLYDEWTWSEMIIVPRRQILTLIEPE